VIHVAARPSSPIPPYLEAASCEEGAKLLETIICDLHWRALHTATLATLMTANIDTNANWTLRPWRHVLVGGAGDSMQLALRYDGRAGLQGPAAKSIASVYKGFAALKESSASLVLVVRSYNSQERQLLAQCAPQWRRLSREMATLLRSLKASVQLRVGDDYAADCQTLLDFSEEAASGVTRRVNAWGNIELPQLRQRRQAPRMKVARNCEICTDRERIPAVMTDLSRLGMGVTCDRALASCEPVTVAFTGGRSLRATVVRTTREGMGLRFIEELLVDDPLLRTS